MSEISSRPWGIAHTRDAADSYRRYIEDSKGKRIAAMYHKDFCDYATCMPDANQIIKCVNEHDALVAEVERLKRYVHENGHCGYLGTRYGESMLMKMNCSCCIDNEHCERYQIIKDGANNE
jgi:hypothetical protein